MKVRLALVAMSALLLSSCGTVSSSQAVRTWTKQSNFTSNTATIVRDMRTSAAQLRDASSAAPVLHTVCGVLLTDTEAANSSLPTPDQQATKWLGLAYADIGAGANTCYNAATSATLRARALNYLRRGSAELNFGVLRLGSAAAG